MCGIKIPQQEFALKMQGGLMHEGGGVFAGHYSMHTASRKWLQKSIFEVITYVHRLVQPS